MNRFFIEKDDTMLMIIDIQERLFNAMGDKVKASLIKNCSILMKTAAEFKIPMIITEQYRKGLGETIPELRELTGDNPNLEKLFFDCMKDEAIRDHIMNSTKSTVIITGIESHICVLQTALSLLARGKKVIIASDGVGSRRKSDWKAALDIVSKAGAIVYPSETIAFMIIEKAGTEEFKKLSPIFK